MSNLYRFNVLEWTYRYLHTWPGQVKQKFKSGHGKARKIAAQCSHCQAESETLNG